MSPHSLHKAREYCVASSCGPLRRICCRTRVRLNEEIMVRSHLIDLSQTTHAVRPGLAFLTKYSDLKENNSIRNQITCMSMIIPKMINTFPSIPLYLFHTKKTVPGFPFLFFLYGFFSFSFFFSLSFSLLSSFRHYFLPLFLACSHFIFEGCFPLHKVGDLRMNISISTAFSQLP